MGSQRVFMTDTNRPQVVLEREDYSATFELLFEDFKARYKIHQYDESSHEGSFSCS